MSNGDRQNGGGPGVRVEHPLPAFIYQRVGSAAAGLLDSGEYWVTVAENGAAVRRQPSTASDAGSSEGHNFLIKGSGTARKRDAEVVEVNVTIRRGQETETVRLSGRGFDALFWGPGSINKFVAPYYCATLGPDYAHAIMQTYRDDTTIAALCHTPTSEDCSVRAGMKSVDQLVEAAITLALSLK